MQRTRLGGGSMIAGAVMGVVVMVFHPTGHDVMRDPFQGVIAFVVHALALFSVPIAFYGGFALTRRLSPPGALAELALVFYATAGVATMMAATASGFLVPGLLADAMSHGEGRGIAGALLHYNFDFNQAFAKILVAASSVAIGLWSIEIARTRLISRGTGIYGCIIAVVALVVLLSGHLRLDVHGFGAVVLAQAIWLVLVGIELLREAPRAPRPREEDNTAGDHR